MRVSSILALLSASALAAAGPDAPVVTPFLPAPGAAAPTTLVPVPMPVSSASYVSVPPPPPPPSSSNSTSAALPSTVTSIKGATRTVTLQPAKTNAYESCGGLSPKAKPCPASFECIDDPFSKIPKYCGLKCDQLGICVVPIMCGGFAGIKCPDGKTCVDDPRDSCDPRKGGADCAGLCI